MTFIADNTFAAACYDLNTIEELESVLQADVEQVDLDQWGLTESEYKNELKRAIQALKEDQ